MVELSVAEFEKSFDEYMDRIEAGEKFIIRDTDGKAVVAVPADEYHYVLDKLDVETADELIEMYSDHEEGS